jgi:hypothetical protein
MDRPALLIPVSLPVSIDGTASERWEHWMQKGRDHDRLMLERWRELAIVVMIGFLLTAATVLALR